MHGLLHISHVLCGIFMLLVCASLLLSYVVCYGGVFFAVISSHKIGIIGSLSMICRLCFDTIKKKDLSMVFHFKAT